jgi:hypothetical protein
MIRSIIDETITFASWALLIFAGIVSTYFIDNGPISLCMHVVERLMRVSVLILMWLGYPA